MTALKVWLRDTEVGVLEQLDDERQRFSFCDVYTSSMMSSRPVLGQIFEDRFPQAISVDGPICWFSHLLPQGVMLRWRSQLLGLDETDTFSLLSLLGGDLPGAVRLTPGESILKPASFPPLSNLTTPAPGESLLRFSLAGAQWKLSARSAGRGLTTKAHSGGTACIAKFHSPDYPGLPHCEFATMFWARTAGLQTPEFSLRSVADFDQIPEEMPTGDGHVYVIDRFDRTETDRIHIEDFGQILDRPPGQHQFRGSLEEIGSVIRWIAPQSAVEFLRTVVFHVIAGNGDAHRKNFSVIYRDGRHAELSPAYDIVSTVLYRPPGKEDLALTLNNQRSFAAVNLQSFIRLFDALQVERSVGESVVRDFARQALGAWYSPDVQANYTTEQVSLLGKHIGSVPLSQT
jgi:serine/threonine-protein kinase HipA